MWGPRCSLLVSLSLITASMTWPEPPSGKPKRTSDAVQPVRVDVYGEPLPAGAVARLGTLRLRQGGPYGSVAFSPNGKWLVSYGRGESVQVSEVAGGRTVADATTGAIEGVHIIADEILAVRSDDKTVTAAAVAGGQFLNVWAVHPELKKLFTIEDRSGIRAAAFSRDGKTLATGAIKFWDAATGKPLRTFPAPDDMTKVLLFSPDGKRLARVGERTVGVWDLATGKEQRLVDAPPGGDLFCVAFSRDGTTLAVGAYRAGLIRLWDMATGQERTWPDKEFGTRALAFSPDAKTLAHGGEAGLIHLRHAASGKLSGQLKAGYNIYSLAFTPDSKTVAASMALFLRRQTRLWDVATAKELVTFPRHEQRIETVAFSAGGDAVVTASVDQTIRVWEAATGKQLFQIGDNQPTDERLRAPPCVFSPDGKTLIAGTKATIAFWNVNKGKETHRWESLEGAVVSLAISRDGKRLASLSVDRQPAPEATDFLFHYHTVQVRDVATGKVLLTIPKLDRRTRSLGFSPDGKLLVVVAYHDAKNIVLYDTTSGKQVQALDAAGSVDGHYVPCFAFSADGNLLAVAGKLRLFEAAIGKLVRTLDESGSFRSIAFSPNGKVLAAAGSERRCLFDVASGKVLWQNGGYEGSFRGVAFSPDGTKLATASEDGTALIWALAPGLINP